jgi:hypothetical protein
MCVSGLDQRKYVHNKEKGKNSYFLYRHSLVYEQYAFSQYVCIYV